MTEKNRLFAQSDSPEAPLKRKRWDKHAIKAEVHRRGATLTQIAVEAGLEESACRAALIRTHKPAEQALSAFLGVDVTQLWPDRYLPPHNRVESNATNGVDTSQKRSTPADIKEAA